MGFGGFLGKLVEVAADVVTLPVSVAKDLFTMGGVVIDEPPATIEKLRAFKEHLVDACEELDD